MNLGFLIAVCSGLILFFILFYLFGTLHYHKAEDHRFNPLSYFPYEEFEGPNDAFLSLARIFAGAFLIAQGLSAVLLLGAEEPNATMKTFSILVAILGGMEMVLLFFLLLLPAKYARAHIFVVVFYFCISVLYGVLGGSLLYGQAVYNDALAKTLGIILMVLGFIVLALLINPRFTNWARLHAENTSDGEKIVFRPRFFILAASEWLVLILNIIMTILILLGLYFLHG
ncbi:MAG: hypothetical protein BWY98_01047 [Tenericutes bacterium ADurb.BinA155]|jgi:hypothetical protein|nr:MAG: hypothetical protein BWY98_01047 [Tenericutes bacterium ADurb.BinA155]